MQFLKTLFWVVVAAALVLFARDNWAPVTISLWSGLQADVKLPALLAFVFLLGFLPTYLYFKGRVWTLRRRLGPVRRVTVANQPDPVPAEPADTPQPSAAI